VAEALARSPIAPAPPVAVERGWQVSARRSDAALRITDCSPLGKILVRASPGGEVDRALGLPFGRAARDERGALVVRYGPGEWLLLTPPGDGAAAAGRVDQLPGDDLTSVVEVTSGLALMRVTGEAAAAMLTKVCGIDLTDGVTPDGAVFRSSVARLAAGVVRDDRDGERSYLLQCDRSSGQYLFDALLDAGHEFGIDVDGFVLPGI
jgi:heterotetrameric sarcosine oxidase gamma subunit